MLTKSMQFNRLLMLSNSFGICRVLILICLSTAACFSQDRSKSSERINLYEGAVPGALGKGEGHEPHGLLYRAKDAGEKTPVVVVLPGGGYGGLAIDHEGYQIADWLNQHGITAFICIYRHRGGGYGHPIPKQDALRAVRLVRANANQWNVDPSKVGIIGFSAGGHLASTVATQFDQGDANSSDPVEKQSSRPDFAVLCYPVIGMGKPYTHGGSQRNLLGENASEELIKSMSSEERVTKETPPVFLLHTFADTAVVPENSLQFYQSMIKHGVPGELHVFEKGPHGVGLAKNIEGTSAWPELCMRWLEVRGILKSGSR